MDKNDAARIEVLEAALCLARAERDAAWRELDELARYLSHDLRAPLRGIDGYSRALVEDFAGCLDPLALSYLQYIRESGHLAAGVVDKLIHYIRIPRGELNLQPIDLTGLAEEIFEQMRQRLPQGGARRVHLHATPGCHAYADQRLARLLLEILLENAWKFTASRDDATIQLGQRYTEHDPVFFVRDNGVGFDSVYAGNLFQPFQRLHSAHEFEGAGMGLAVARRIVERHDGRIWSEGAVNHGASFYFSLPQDENPEPHEILEKGDS